MTSSQFIYSIGLTGVSDFIALLRDETRSLTSAKRKGGVSHLKIENFNRISAGLFKALFSGKLERPMKNGSPLSTPHSQSTAATDRGEGDGSFFEAAAENISVSSPVRLGDLKYFGDSHQDILSEYSSRYEAFKAAADAAALCVKWRTKGSHTDAVLYMPVLDKSLAVGKGPPVRLHVSGGASGFQVKCTCELSRVAGSVNRGSSAQIPGAEGAICWHERYALDHPNLKLLMHHIRPIQGLTFDYADFYFSVLNESQSATTSAPQYLYVFCSAPDRRSLLGTTKEAIVTVSNSRMTCSICHSGRRNENSTPKADRRPCPHIDGLLSRIEDVELDTESLVLLRKVFSLKRAILAPAFNKETQEFEFPSLSSDIEREMRDKYGRSVPDLDMLTKFGDPPAASFLGGKHDAVKVALKVSLEFVKSSKTMTIFSILKKHALIYPVCPCTAQGFSNLEHSSELFTCDICQSEISDRATQGGLISCLQCGVRCCEACIEVGFTPVFHVIAPSVVSWSTSMRLSPPEACTRIKQEIFAFAQRDEVLDLIPTIPDPPPDEAGCSFDDATLAYTSTAYFVTQSRPVNVYHYVCTKGCCKIEPTGAELGCHRQSRETMISYDVFKMFNQVTRSMRGPGAKSFTSHIQLIYDINSAGKFLCDDTFS